MQLSNNAWIRRVYFWPRVLLVLTFRRQSLAADFPLRSVSRDDPKPTLAAPQDYFSSPPGRPAATQSVIRRSAPFRRLLGRKQQRRSYSGIFFLSPASSIVLPATSVSCPFPVNLPLSLLSLFLEQTNKGHACVYSIPSLDCYDRVVFISGVFFYDSGEHHCHRPPRPWWQWAGYPSHQFRA